MFLLEALKKYAAAYKIAIRYREKTLSFAELDRFSDAFAAWLVHTFGSDRTPIMIYGHKELYIPVCMFGALKAGRGYVPVDTTFPKERAAQIAEEVQPRVIVDFYRLGLDAPAVLDAGALEKIFASGGGVSQEKWIAPEDTAYILFTSGSTGRPKGVQITAGNIASFYKGAAPWLALPGEGGVCLNEISYSFDVSVCALYYALSQGMTLYTVDRETLNNTPALFAALRESGVNLWVSTPSLGEICLQSEQFCTALLPGAKKFVFCGEVMTCKLGRQMLERFPGAKVYNAYGPTEAAVLVTAVEVTEELCAARDSLPIGYSFSNLRCEIASLENGAYLPDGEKGELLILGSSVSPGYLNRPELNEKVFFEENGVRGYRTGDLCFREAGLIYYLGRLDGQVKLNGFRVELEDVESCLTRVPNIARAAVLPVFQDGKVTGLTAFVLLEKPDGLSSLKRAKQIKETLAEILPVYMIPRKILAVDSFPLNTNGKVDKKTLAETL